MSDQSPLILPMTVEALVVNDILRTNRNNSFVRNQMAYNAMQIGANAQPGIDNNDTNFTAHSTVPVPPNNVPAGQFYNGVYLKWRLPRAFTRGTHDSGQGVTRFPVVPNRWLIVRYSGPLNARQATAWVVESDYLYPDNQNPSAMNASQVASIYVQPEQGTQTPIGVPMGRNVQLATTSWSESGHDLRLTAMGPGNPAFAVYQPQCNNVFSFIDCLDGQVPETLSYMVCGWYSASVDDPLGQPGNASVIVNPSSGTAAPVFTASSAAQVGWTAGSLVAPGGAVYSVVAGTTGIMSLPTYVYLDPSVSATTLQTTTVIATAQTSGCVFVATATPLFQAQLAWLGVQLPQGTDPSLTASWSLLYGAVDGVQWQNTTLPPGGAPNPENGIPVSVAVGNTTVEALTAMITAQANAQNVPIDSELLEAFQLDLVDVFDKPDGAAILAEKLQASFFQKFSGGYLWAIVDAPDATTPVSATELAIEQAWLATLSQNQIQLDQAINQLATLQAQLYAMWWKYTIWGQAFQGSTPIDGLGDQTGLQNQLDPTFAGSLAQSTLRQIGTVQALQAQVPQGNTPDALALAIQNYSSAQKLPSTRVLKRSGGQTFFMPNNPVVLLAGAGASGIVQSADSILCRFAAQLVSGFKFDNKTITAATNGLSIPQPDLSRLSGAPWTAAFLNLLVQEFFFLDPNNATMVTAAISGSTVAAVQTAMSNPDNDLPVYPAGAVQQWTQNPWHPLLLFWQAYYYPTGYGTAQAPNWSFADGRYFWNGSQTSIGPRTVFQGTAQLAPTANFNMAARIKAFLKNNPDLDPLEAQEFQALLSLVQNDDNWDLLSQALDGFNNQIQLGLPGVFLSPGSTALSTTPPLPSLIGGAVGYPPSLGNIPTSAPYPPSGFQPWRAGQFEFLQLVLIDEWGQALWPVSSSNYQHEKVYMPVDLSPVLTSLGATFQVVTGPAIAAISPTVALAANGPLTLTVTGLNFASGASVQWNGAALATQFISATQLTATVGAAHLASAGAAIVTVASGGATSNALPFTIASGPAIGALSPSLMQAGMATSSQFTITIDGAGFAAGAVAQWNGTAVDTEFVSPTQLAASVPASFAFAPGTAAVTVLSGGATSNSETFTLSPGAAVVSLSPPLVATGAAGFVLTVNGVGFEPAAVVAWNGAALATSFVGPNQLTAQVTPQQLATAGAAMITASIGSSVLLNAPDCLIQLPPSLLQPARLNFDLISNSSDSVVFGPANPGADPICGWVLPNHLDSALMAYDPSGASLGEMSVGIAVSGTPEICWAPAPGTALTLQQIAQSIPHFGDFLLTLSQQTPVAFDAFLAAIDETLWTTAPMGASFDQSLSVLIGRPLAMVRAQLQFELAGSPISDPSWQYTFAPAAAGITTYQFAIELGNLAQLEDGLIGYFVTDQYGAFNVVAESGAAGSDYLKVIGQDGNYIYLPFDGKTSLFVSMLVDPYAAVHATTAIVPVASIALPPQFTTDALAAMSVTFRVDGILTDQQIDKSGNTTVLLPVPKQKTGQWTWLEDEGESWTSYDTAANDPAARLSNVPPVLRRGYLKLSSALRGGRK
jgi:IPT/TIG domain